MQFRIADSFTASLAKLNGTEQKAVKTTAFDLQLNPASSGFSFHKIDRARDPNFWSVRVNRDIRLIVHKTGANLLLCYVDHHDKAYKWAERRKLETHPKTGAAQFVEIRETIREIIIPTYVAGETPPKPILFADTPLEDLLSFGVPVEWIEEVRKVDEDSLLELADYLPAEAAEALLDLATGGTPQVATPLKAGADPFEHPDAQRRFRVIDNQEELAQALEFPWEKWTLFLHPAQRKIVAQSFAGPARVSGSAGTGKTVVALHRAVHLTRSHPDARVLLTTFSSTLARSLDTKMRRLIHHEPMLGERLEVHALNIIAERLYRRQIGRINIASEAEIQALLTLAAQEEPDHTFSDRFLRNEWERVVDAWQLKSWEAYRDVLRLGRRTRLPESKRQKLWAIFEHVRAAMEKQQLITQAGLLGRLTETYRAQPSPFDFAVVDEAQDINVAQLRFLAALVGNRPDGLFFAGDLGQRIFQQPFSWKSLGVNIQGRSYTLKINYRTSHQIRRQADLLLGPEIADVDGNVESRRGTISVFNGPSPEIERCETEEVEIARISTWLAKHAGEGIPPHEMGVFVRSEAELSRALAAVKASGMDELQLGETISSEVGKVSVSTMHLAKGLEFRVVAVMACDDEVIPSSTRIAAISDDADLDEVYHTERHLLYVACTRARDHLLITSGKEASEFLDDLEGC